MGRRMRGGDVLLCYLEGLDCCHWRMSTLNGRMLNTQTGFQSKSEGREGKGDLGKKENRKTN